MAETRKGLRLQDFEKLLCEIPKTTSGYPCTESKRVSFGDGLSPILTDSCKGQPYSSKGPYSEKFPSNGIFLKKKTSVDQVDNISLVNEVTLPDEQSMASAFADLKIENGLAREAMSLPLANDVTVHNNALGLDYNDLKIHSLTAHSQWNNVYSPESKIIASSCYDQFAGAKYGQCHAELLKYDSQSLKNQQVGVFQSLGSSNALMPINNGVQLLHNVHVPTVEFPVVPSEKQYCMSAPSSFPYFHRPHRNECQIIWRSEEEEKPYQMYRQNLHLLQNSDYQVEAKHPVHMSANFASSLVHQYPRIQQNQVPVTHQFGQFEEGTFLHNNGSTRCMKKMSLGFSSADVCDVQVLERTVQASYPEKILTSSHNLNSLRGVKFGSIPGNESVNHVNQDGRHTLSGQHHHCVWSPTPRYSLADGFDPWLLSSDATYIKSCDSRLLSQKSIGVDEVRGRIHLMAKDQHGCRLLQRKISEGPREAVEKIFIEVIDGIVELMTDPFGNYLVQKLLEVCNEDQQTQMLQEITRKPGDLVRISCDMHGTRAVQKVIETLKTPDHISIVVNSLKPCIVTLMKNMNGNHVAQRCLQFLIPAYTQFLFEAAAANCVELATDRHGCCVLQKCLSHSGGEHRQRLISEIISNALILSQDQFGNYVVQFIFELQVPQAIRILDQLEGKYGDLSMQKYSSNVVEKCLKHSGEEGRKRIIQEFIYDPRLDQIMQDAYGNYVIQAALNLSEGALEDALVEAIKPHVPVLRTSPYGKKVLSSSNRLKKQSPQEKVVNWKNGVEESYRILK